jgi:hypothetical protein
MHSAQGQGTVEYLAVVLLVLVVLGGGSATVATAAGADIATAVPHQVMRALCIVTRGDCDRDRAPCAVGSSTASSAWSATIAVVRLGHGRVLVRERRSDGSEVVTLTTSPSVGLQTTEGAALRIDRGRRRLAFGGAVTASVVAALGHGRSWVLPGHDSAEALVAALRRDDPVPPPDQELRQVDVIPGVTATRGAGKRAAEATATVTATPRGSIGRSTDRNTGRQKYFLEAGADAVLGLSVRLRSLRAAGSATGGASARMALTVDRAGRWVDLALVGTGELSATATLPASAGPIADALNVPGSAGRRWVAEAHLDLSDAANRAAAAALIARLHAIPPRPDEVGEAAAELARRVDERAIVDVRGYALESARNGFALNVGEGAGVGVGHESSTEHTRLIAASTRGLDGLWRRRTDCLKEAHA